MTSSMISTSKGDGSQHETEQHNERLAAWSGSSDYRLANQFHCPSPWRGKPLVRLTDNSSPCQLSECRRCPAGYWPGQDSPYFGLCVRPVRLAAVDRPQTQRLRLPRIKDGKMMPRASNVVPSPSRISHCARLSYFPMPGNRGHRSVNESRHVL
jgi:hypothetical protein